MANVSNGNAGKASAGKRAARVTLTGKATASAGSVNARVNAAKLAALPTANVYAGIFNALAVYPSALKGSVTLKYSGKLGKVYVTYNAKGYNPATPFNVLAALNAANLPALVAVKAKGSYFRVTITLPPSPTAFYAGIKGAKLPTNPKTVAKILAKVGL